MNWFGYGSEGGWFLVPAIILQCVGILALSSWKKHPGWWLLIAAVVMEISSFVAHLVLLRSGIKADHWLTPVLVNLYKMPGLAALVFAFGFSAVAVAISRAGIVSPESGRLERKGGGRRS